MKIISASDACMKTENYINEKVIIHMFGILLYCFALVFRP
jgi:hypothetical protein